MAASSPRVSVKHYTGSLELASSLFLAPYLSYLRPPSNLVLFFFFSSSLTGRSRRKLVSAHALPGALSPLKPELKKTHVED